MTYENEWHGDWDDEAKEAQAQFYFVHNINSFEDLVAYRGLDRRLAEFAAKIRKAISEAKAVCE